MKQFLRAELYRMKKSKSPLILLIVCFGVSLMNGFTFGFLFGNAGWLTEFYENALGGNPFDIYGEIAGEGLAPIRSLGDFVSLNVAGTDGIFLILFIAIFLASLKRSGFIRNIASEYGRTQIFFTHVLLTAVYAFALVILSAAGSLIMFFVFFRGLPVESFPDFIVYLLTAWLLMSATGVMMLVLVDVVKKINMAVIAALVYLEFWAPIIFSFTGSSGFSLRFVSLVGNLDLLTVGDWNTVLSSLLVIVFYMTGAVLLETLVIKKRDLL